MFLFSNIYDRPYSKLYPSISKVIFDLSEEQLRNSKNKDWFAIKPRALACVPNSSRKISTIYRVESAPREAVPEGEPGVQFVLTGVVVAKLPNLDMTTMLNKHGVSHPYLPRNRFITGFNVADLGRALDGVEVETRELTIVRRVNLGSLEEA